MKKIAIYNVFDGEELLEGSIKQIRDSFDEVIAIVQTTSNHGETYLGGYNEVIRLKTESLIDNFIAFVPTLSLSPFKNETNKRNLGVEYAKNNGFTHFMHLDCDEYWEQVPEPDQAHRMYTYFKTPNLRYDTPESYFVAGLITLKPNTQVGSFNCGFYCDPTRKPNHKLTEGKEMMHHFSYVRYDMERKINNSSAKANIQAKHKELMNDLSMACDGYQMSFNEKKLIFVKNIFNIDYSS